MHGQRPSPSPNSARPLAAGQVFVVMLVALLGGALLNAQGILLTAEQQEPGVRRTLATGMAEPLASISAFLRIDVARETVDEALGRAVPRRDLTVAAPTTGTTVTQTPATTPSTSSAPPNPATTTTTTAPISTTTTMLPALRRVSVEKPLNLWIIGDSFAELFGPALVNRSTDTGLIDAEVDFRYISGLSRPDFFDWPAYIGGELSEQPRDAAVVIFGGNDGIDVEVGGEHFDLGSEAWIELYAARVGEAMDALLEGVDCVYWVGLPIMRSDSFTAKVEMMNAVYQAEAEKRPQVTYISSFELFTDEDGQYSAYLDGKLMRFKDGAHFVWNGGYRLADAVLPVITSQWRIELNS